MPVRKFRDAPEMESTPWKEPGTPDLFRAIKSVWSLRIARVTSDTDHRGVRTTRSSTTSRRAVARPRSNSMNTP